MAGLYVDMKIMGYNLSCPKGVKVSKIKIRGKHGQISILIARKEGITEPATGVMWIHGGGYATGFKEMLYMGRGMGSEEGIETVRNPQMPVIKKYIVDEIKKQKVIADELADDHNRDWNALNKIFIETI